MSVTLTIVVGDKVVTSTALTLQEFYKSNVERILRQKFVLESNFKITYIDSDGDQIMVEFDEDYDVAKMTFQGENLVLSVQPDNQNWHNQYLQKISQIQKDKEDAQLKKMKEQEAQLEYFNEKIKQNLLDLQSIEKPSIDNASLQNPNGYILLNEEERDKKSQSINEQKLNLYPVQKPKSLNKKTETQSQSQQSQIIQMKSNLSDQSNKQQNVFIPQKSNQKNEKELKKQTIDLKPVKIKKNQSQDKKIKQQKKQKKVQKEDIQEKYLTQKQVKKLIRKQLFRLMPQLQEKALLINQSKIKNQTIQQEQQSINTINDGEFSLECTNCNILLTVPFFINSQQFIRLCDKCEGQDQSDINLVKIRNKSMVTAIWAQPICQSIANLKFNQEKNPIKFYNQLMRNIVNDVKQNFTQKTNNLRDLQKNKKTQNKPKKMSVQSSD